MSVQVVPAILEERWEDIQKKVEQVSPYVDLIQIDIMDGVFVAGRTYSVPSDIATLDARLELHLMIDRPEFHIMQWALPNVDRIIVHYEAAQNLGHVIELIRGTGKEVGVALNPETPSHVLESHIDAIDCVLVMGVQPGASGQDFIRDSLEKIKELRRMRADIRIAVDGGVKKRSARWMVEAGADALGVNSYLWNSGDIEQAIKELEALG